MSPVRVLLIHLAIVLTPILVAPVSAAVLTVGASGCDHVTLDAAITAAQPGDELRLRTQTFAGVSESITKSLTLRGGYSTCGDEIPGLGEISVIEGTGTDSVFTIGGGSTTTVELIKLEVTGGDSALFGGGVSILSGSTLRLATVEFHGNSGGSGGAIFVGPDSILEHSGPVTLRDNVADRGGALYVSGTSVADFSTIGFNPVTVEDNAAQEGGGIYVGGGGSLVTDGDHRLTVRSNQAQAGGGIFADTSASIELIDDVIRQNLASIGGGGLFVAGDGSPVATPTIRMDVDTEFLLNQAGAGGGAAFGSGGGYQAEVAATFQNNTAVQHGGGMLIAGDGVFDLDLAVFRDNEAGTTGGGLQIEASSVIAGRLSASSNRADVDGGGLYMSGPTSLLIDRQMIVRSNQAGGSGGGIALRDGAFLQVSGDELRLDLLLQGNVAETGNGGGLHAQNSIIDVDGALIGLDGFANRAPAGRGGGAYIDSDLDWSLLNSRIIGNESSGNGAALYIAGGADFVVGGLPAAGSAPVRGSVPCDPFGLERGDYCAEVRGNRSDFGAAIAIVDDASASRELSDIAIVDNEGANPASAVLANAPGITIRNALIARNRGSSSIFVGAERDVELEHLSLLFNDRGLLGGANAVIHVDHSMFWGNGLYGFLPGGGTTIDGSCNLGRSNLLPDALALAPRFITTSRGLYRLSNQSPALDACTFGLLSADIDGLSRPAGSNSDIGALEGAWGTSEVLLSDSFEEGPLASPALPSN